MFETLRNAWKIQELRKKILFTLFIIIIFRIGSAIPVPFLDASVMASWMQTQNDNILGYMNVLTGGSLSRATILALSITPYINASIIVQLLTFAIPPLERLQKEGETGRKKIQKISDFVSLGLAIFMAVTYYLAMRNAGAVIKFDDTFSNIFAAIVIVAVFTAGSSMIIWLGSRINEKGLGNGISMILFAGIVARGPEAILSLFMLIGDKENGDMKYIFLVPLIIIIFILMIGFIVLMNESERRIPIQYAKRVVGRKQYGGQNTHIPIKMVMSGVMPIIFAMSVMQVPSFIINLIGDPKYDGSFWDNFYQGFRKLTSHTSIGYSIIYFILIIAFNYFYVAMTYNPIEIANNLRQSNGGIPGIRPGKPTSDYIQRVLSKITLVGAIFLGVIAIFPILFNAAIPQLNIAMGGTTVLIIVSVALETVRSLESQMMMRHHKGFLE